MTAKLYIRLFAATLCALGATCASAATINGRVFEDVNYGGGAGRAFGASGTVGIANVRVELYNATGTLVDNDTTDTNGLYSFTYTGNAARIVRVVNGTVKSSRTTCTTCVPVQTYRTNVSSGNVVAVTDHVGGEDPTLSDPATNTATNLFSLDNATRTPQSITTVAPLTTGATVNGVDFGFNFDTIVNDNDATTANCAPSGTNSTFFPCQGSLRQFVINSNALGGEASLSQAGSGSIDGLGTALPGGFESSIFMVPAGQLNAAGAVEIVLAAALPTIAGANTRLDATTQTINIGDTNGGILGTGGTVGVDALGLPFFQRPEVQLTCGDTQVTLNGANESINGFALRQGYILLAGASETARNNLVGMRADGTSGDTAGAFYGITISGTNDLVRNNFVTVNDSGIRSDSGGTGMVISYNEVARPSSGHTNTFDGILIVNAHTGGTITANLTRAQRGGGIEIGFGAQTDTISSITVSNNTVTNNGFDSGSTASTEPVGMASYLYTGSNVVYSRNRVFANAGPGLIVMAATGTQATQNSFSNNGGVAIDLDPNTRDPNTLNTPNGVTLNDAGDADTGPNGLLNYPVIASAILTSGQLTISGFARPGSSIELYSTPTADPSGFGEGTTFLGTLTEGSAGDADTGTGTYGPAAINGVAQGTDTTNRFRFQFAVPAGVAVGSILTATATVSGQTSEFGGDVIVTGGPTLAHRKTVQILSDPLNGTTNPKSVPGAIEQFTLRITNTGTGIVDSDTFAITDTIPANTELFVGDLGAAGSGPVQFTNGTPASGITWTYTALGNATDCLDFSNDGGATWGYTPTSTGGYDSAVTNIRLKPRGAMNGASGGGNPYFELRFNVRVK